MTETLPAKIVRAINQSPAALPGIFADHPEQLHVQTFMAGQTWLGCACQKGLLDVIKTMVDLGADLNQGNNHTGARPLVSAGYFGHDDVAEYLLKQGSRVDTDSSEVNPLLAAIVGRSVACVRLLLDTGIDAIVRRHSKTMTSMDAVAFALMRGEQASAEMIADHLAIGDAARAAVLLGYADKVAELNAYPAKHPKARAAKMWLDTQGKHPEQRLN